MPVYALGSLSPELPDPDRYWIAPDAAVIGDLMVGDEVSIWFGSVLRADNARITIGARSNIQDGTTIHVDEGVPATLGEGVVVGHRVKLHGCTIGDNCLIGIGATILNHVRIGRNSIVGANSLITEGKEFEDNSVIFGSPARLVRTTSPEAAAMIREAADHYVHQWRKYAASLRRIA